MAATLPLIRTFFEAVKGQLPSGTTLTYPGSGDVVTIETGIVTGGWSATPPAATVGTGTGVFSGRTGGVVGWTTGTVVGRRLVRGRTFIVPIVAAAYDSDGTLQNATVAAWLTAAQALATNAAAPLIYHRPVGGSGGIAPQMNGAKVNDRVQVLTSRMH
jgi:hypothetical protein